MVCGAALRVTGRRGTRRRVRRPRLISYLKSCSPHHTVLFLSNFSSLVRAGNTTEWASDVYSLPGASRSSSVAPRRASRTTLCNNTAPRPLNHLPTGPTQSASLLSAQRPHCPSAQAVCASDTPRVIPVRAAGLIVC